DVDREPDLRAARRREDLMSLGEDLPGRRKGGRSQFGIGVVEKVDRIAARPGENPPVGREERQGENLSLSRRGHAADLAASPENLELVSLAADERCAAPNLPLFDPHQALKDLFGSGESRGGRRSVPDLDRGKRQVELQEDARQLFSESFDEPISMLGEIDHRAREDSVPRGELLGDRALSPLEDFPLLEERAAKVFEHQKRGGTDPEDSAIEKPPA